MYRMPWYLSPIAGVRYCSMPIQKATTKKNIFFKSFKIKIPASIALFVASLGSFLCIACHGICRQSPGYATAHCLFRRQLKKTIFSKALKSKFRLRQHCLWHRQDHFYVSHAMVAVANLRGTLLLTAYSEGNYKKTFFSKALKSKFRFDSIVCGIARIIFMYRMPWYLSPISGVRYCSLPIQKATKIKTIFFKSFKIKIPASIALFVASLGSFLCIACHGSCRQSPGYATAHCYSEGN